MAFIVEFEEEHISLGQLSGCHIVYTLWGSSLEMIAVTIE